MTSLPYVLIVLFALNDGDYMIMRTSQGFVSPLTCSMHAFLENETSKSRTYVCVTRDRADQLGGNNAGQAAVLNPSNKGSVQ